MVATSCACTAGLSTRRSREGPRPILPIFVLYASGKFDGLVSYGGGDDCATSSTSYSCLLAFLNGTRVGMLPDRTFLVGA